MIRELDTRKAWFVTDGLLITDQRKPVGKGGR